MTPGRELDALVAEIVFHVHVEKRFGGEDTWHINNPMPIRHLPNYSTSIADAWLVVEKLREQWAVEIHGRLGVWSCVIEEGDEVTCRYIADGESETAPHAICLAALKAVGVEES